MAQPFFFLVLVVVSFFSFVALSLIVHLFPFVVRSCRSIVDHHHNSLYYYNIIT